MLVAADRPERETALKLLIPMIVSSGGHTIVCDKGYAGRAFEHAARDQGALIARPSRRDEAATGFKLATLRQRVESVFQTCKDILGLERHGARTHTNLRARIALRLLALTACINLNHQLGRPSRALANYTA